MDTTAASQVLGPMYEHIAADGALALKELSFAPDAAILDVGTGKGNFAIFLASQGFNVLTGEPSTDTSHYAGQDWAKKAEALGVLDRIRFQSFDAGEMPFEANSFDAVFFFGVLHHVDESQREGVLSESLRVSKPEGAVVFFEPRRETLEKLWVDDPGHPLAANPSEYLAGQNVREQRLAGSMMDLFVFRKAE